VSPETFDVVPRGYDPIGERYRDWSSDSGVRRRYLARLLAKGGLVPFIWLVARKRRR
jgi:hypothetical protein